MSKVAPRGSGRLAELRSATKELSPAYMAMVMATGIVSIASFMLGMAAIGWILFVINISAVFVYLAVSSRMTGGRT